MKRILLFLNSIVVSGQLPFFSLVSCQNKKQEFISANIDDSMLNLLFSNNEDITSNFPINFNYLNYYNNSWIEEGYDDIVGSFKISHPLISNIDYDVLTSDNKDFITKLEKYFEKEENNPYVADLTGLTLNIESVFINSLSFSSDFQNIKSNTTCAITLSKGWNSFAKCVLSINLNSTFYSKFKSLELMNYFIKKTNDNLSISAGTNSNGEECYYIYNWSYGNDITVFSTSLSNNIEKVYSNVNLSDFDFKENFNDSNKSFSINGINYYINP